MSEIQLEINIEIPIISPLKNQQKEDLLKILNENLQLHVNYANLKEFFYMEKRSADNHDTLKIVFDMAITMINGASALLWILNFLLKMNPKNIINVRKKNGQMIRLFDGMTEEEIRNQLDGE